MTRRTRTGRGIALGSPALCSHGCGTSVRTRKLDGQIVNAGSGRLHSCTPVAVFEEAERRELSRQLLDRGVIDWRVIFGGGR